jgi:hypothetical protein
VQQNRADIVLKIETTRGVENLPAMLLDALNGNRVRLAQY